jgi:hypothetical protein
VPLSQLLWTAAKSTGANNRVRSRIRRTHRTPNVPPRNGEFSTARLIFFGTTWDLFLALWCPNAAIVLGDASSLASWNSMISGS